MTAPGVRHRLRRSPRLNRHLSCLICNTHPVLHPREALLFFITLLPLRAGASKKERVCCTLKEIYGNIAITFFAWFSLLLEPLKYHVCCRLHMNCIHFLGGLVTDWIFNNVEILTLKIFIKLTLIKQAWLLVSVVCKDNCFLFFIFVNNFMKLLLNLLFICFLIILLH